MKQLTQNNYNAIRDNLFDFLHTKGQEMKNEFPVALRWAIKNEAWRHFTDLSGKPFTNMVDWLHYMWPHGTSMGKGEHTLTYEDALKLTEKVSDVHTILLRHAPKGKPGRHHKNNEGVDTLILKREDRSKTATVLSVRLVQEKPRFYEAFISGKYKTITAAAIAAGLISGTDNLRRGKSAYNHMTSKERREFLKWIKLRRLTKQT
jgi:hypothetical protein